MKTLLTLCLLCFVCLFTISANQAPVKWEYHLENGVTEKKINELANEGWELDQTGNFAGTNHPYLIFKRAK